MKNKVFIMETAFARENGLQQGVNSALRYLVDNRQVVLPQMDLNTIFQTKILSMSPTNRIFEHLLADNLMDEYCFVDTSLSSQSIPELLTISDITVDLKQITNARVILASLQEFRNKMIINIAPLIQRTREGYVKVTDVNELHNQVVRGALVSSYYNCNDEMWLNPNLLRYIAQTYSMCISGVLQRLYNLDIPSQMTIAAALTWFIMNRVTDAADEMTMQCDYLGSRLSIRNMIDMFKDSVDDVAQFDLVKLSNLIASIGPDHMKGFNKDIFIRAMARSGASYITMNMALEYPPYWVHQILYALSGNKVYLSNLLQKNKLLKSAGVFLQDLDTCRQFVPTVGFITKGVSNLENEVFLMNSNVLNADSNENVLFSYNKKDSGFSGIITLLNGQSIKCTFECDNDLKCISEKQKDIYETLCFIDMNDLYKKSVLHSMVKLGAESFTPDQAKENEVFSLDSVRIGLDGTVIGKFTFRDNNGFIKEFEKNLTYNFIIGE